MSREGRDTATKVEKGRLRDFHQARWDEEVIFDVSVPGERGIGVPEADKAVVAEVGDGISAIPEALRRKAPPALPEVNQMRVLRHFLRLSQQTMGVDVTADISQGTCTMKYSPKVQEHIAGRNPGITEVHPLQDPETLQGILEVYHKLESFFKELSGLDAFTFQPGGGGQAVYTNASVIKAYHAARGEGHRDEIITTVFSHPVNAAAPATAGYKVVTLMPDEAGYPSLDAMKAALSERTAGIFFTNPDDTGIYNPRIREFVDAAHDAGACARTIRQTSTECWALSGPGNPGSTSVTSISTRPFRFPTAASARAPEPPARDGSWPSFTPCPGSYSTAGDTPWITISRTASGGCGPSWATPLWCSGLMPGSCKWGPKACARSPRSRCSTATTWKR